MPDVPHELAKQLAALYRRLADLLDGRLVNPLPMRVVVHDASTMLWEPQVRDAVEEIARHGHKVAVELELRGRDPRPCQFSLGGSALLAGSVTLGRVTYTQVFGLGSDHAGVEVTGSPVAR